MTRDREPTNGSGETLADRAIDEALSALLDGELDDEEAAALRAQIAEDPGLADRHARFADLDVALRGLPEPALSADLAERTRARLAEQGPGGASGLRPAPERHRSRARPRAGEPRGRPRRVAGRGWRIAASVAAAVVAVVGVTWLWETDPGPRSETRLADRPPGGTPVLAALPDASDEALGIALEFETLRDYDEIAQLELLELLAELEGGGRG